MTGRNRECHPDFKERKIVSEKHTAHRIPGQSKRVKWSKPMHYFGIVGKTIPFGTLWVTHWLYDLYE